MDCGATCIAIILSHYNSSIPINKLRSITGTDLDGASVFGMRRAFEELGFDCRAVSAENDIFKDKDLVCPFIAHIVVKVLL